jgi:hypothetical protein
MKIDSTIREESIIKSAKYELATRLVLEATKQTAEEL